jgi:very-short-patch-repair endonuclease
VGEGLGEREFLRIFMDRKLQIYAKQLRKNATPAEQVLWFHLRAKRFSGFKFKRQKIIGDYIVDFVCLPVGLIVELDGSQHAAQINYDSRRDAWLAEQGFYVCRFWNNQVFEELDAVLEFIYRQLQVRAARLPGD